ncbi:hypothetical protein FPSE_09781 [Fusarium pseudograminearum CS3096]|uniref:Uncharacterized protein n=1 Tax=Fusarium pseudograminearum (strain CS3096) TaxID=1028729 RepID=K3V9F6_FUSPC|nr:hypothetical protein FPSE_09781 [Fusarium pseudograminearum CS3096]EKJ70044.1 hypothetical protein FPSE_09781 [Fusarium pseudograminearum CS3096]
MAVAEGGWWALVTGRLIYPKCYCSTFNNVPLQHLRYDNLPLGLYLRHLEARPRHDGKLFGIPAALSRGWVTSNYQDFNDLVAYISDGQNMVTQLLTVYSNRGIWRLINMERYLSSLPLFYISQCYALLAPERTSVMRKVHALERQDLIEEIRIACTASDMLFFSTLQAAQRFYSSWDHLLQTETSGQHACIHPGALNTVGKFDVGTEIKKVICTNSLGSHNALKAIVSQWPMFTQQDNKTWHCLSPLLISRFTDKHLSVKPLLVSIDSVRGRPRNKTRFPTPIKAAHLWVPMLVSCLGLPIFRTIQRLNEGWKTSRQLLDQNTGIIANLERRMKLRTILPWNMLNTNFTSTIPFSTADNAALTSEEYHYLQGWISTDSALSNLEEASRLTHVCCGREDVVETIMGVWHCVDRALDHDGSVVGIIGSASDFAKVLGFLASHLFTARCHRQVRHSNLACRRGLRSTKAKLAMATGDLRHCKIIKPLAILDKGPPSMQKKEARAKEKKKVYQSDGEESDDIDESNDDNEMATSPKGPGILPPPGEAGFP